MTPNLPSQDSQSIHHHHHVACPKVVHGSISASNVAKELQTSGMNDLCEWWLTSLLLRFNTRENPGKQLRVA